MFCQEHSFATSNISNMHTVYISVLKLILLFNGLILNITVIQQLVKTVKINYSSPSIHAVDQVSYLTNVQVAIIKCYGRKHRARLTGYVLFPHSLMDVAGQEMLLESVQHF